MRSRSSRMIRWAPFWPMPGTVVSVLTSSVPTARRRVSGLWHGQHRLGELGADAAGGLQQLEGLLLVVVGEAEQGQGVLADHQARRQRGLGADAQGGERVGGALQLQADAADLEDRGGQA